MASGSLFDAIMYFLSAVAALHVILKAPSPFDTRSS